MDKKIILICKLHSVLITLLLPFYFVLFWVFFVSIQNKANEYLSWCSLQLGFEPGRKKRSEICDIGIKLYIIEFHFQMSIWTHNISFETIYTLDISLPREGLKTMYQCSSDFFWQEKTKKALELFWS